MSETEVLRSGSRSSEPELHSQGGGSQRVALVCTHCGQSCARCQGEQGRQDLCPSEAHSLAGEAGIKGHSRSKELRIKKMISGGDLKQQERAVRGRGRSDGKVLS